MAPRWYVLTLVVVPALAVVLGLVIGGAPSGSPWAGFAGVRLQERFGSTWAAAWCCWSGSRCSPPPVDGSATATIHWYARDSVDAVTAFAEKATGTGRT